MTRPRKGNLYTLVFAACVGLVCASALTAAHSLLAPWQDANAKARHIRLVLMALRVPGAETASPRSAADLYAAKIRQTRRAGVTLYNYMEGAKLVGVAIPFSGRGYSAPIEGFIGLEPDLKTLRAMVVTYQAETPGLGGQVGSVAFLEQFQGKHVDGLRLVRHGALADNEVDAITGATYTSQRFQAILDKTIVDVQALRSRPEELDDAR